MDEELVESIKEEIQNRDSLCRLCACHTQLLIPIFEGEGKENNLSDKITRHLPIQVVPNDVLPVQICFQCASTVISWDELSESCIEAEQKLKAMFITNDDLQCSPPGPRDANESTSLWEPFSSVDNLSPSNPEMVLSDNCSASEKNSEEVGDAVSKGGETERCLQEMKLEGVSQKLICQFCNIEFSDTSSLGKHFCLHNPMQFPDANGVILHMCYLCPESFGTENDRMTHLQLKHTVDNVGSQETNQNCQYCGRYFRHSSVLNMHILSCRKLIEKFDNDGFCDYVTLDRSLEPLDQDKSRGNFRKNLAKRGSRSSYSSVGRTELKSKAFKAVSDYTNNKFHIDSEDKSNWKRGRQVKDTKEKRVSCAYCMKSFTRKYDAISHVRKSHRSKLEEFLIWLERRKLYLKDKLCSFCDRTFENSEEATKHIQDCHGKNNDDSLVCELCLMSCRSEAELLKHIADHSASDDGSQVSLHITPSQDLPTYLPVVQFAVGGNESESYDCTSSSTSFFIVNGSQTVGEVNSPTVSMSSQVSVTNKTENQFFSVPVNCESLERTDFYSSAPLPEPTNISFNDPTGVVILNERLDGTNILMNSLMNEEEGIKFTSPGITSTKGIGTGNPSVPLIIDPP